MKSKNRAKYEKWLDDRIEKGYTFKYEKGILFAEEVIISVICVETNDTFKMEYTQPKSSLKFAPELVKQVWLNYSDKERWLKSNSKKAISMKCNNCKREYKYLESNIALMFISGSLNKHVCDDCGKKYIELGAEDVEKKRNNIKNMKEELISKIRELGNYNEKGMYATKLDDMAIEELEKLFEKHYAMKVESDRIDVIVICKEDIGMEDYLKKDYNIIEDPNWLKCVEQIEGYFSDDYSDYFDCGQGYYENEASVMCKIGRKFYNVTITAEIGSAKQDRGDRLYWVEDIEKVTYSEIDKPLPKEKITFSYGFTMDVDVKKTFDSYLKENYSKEMN